MTLSSQVLCTKKPHQWFPYRCTRINRSSTEQLIQHPVERIRLRLLHERPVVLFNLRQISDQINVFGLDPLRPLEEFPANKQYWEDQDPASTLASVQQNFRRRRGESTYMRYENKKAGTSHCPFKNTVYPPTNVMMNVVINPYHAAYGWNRPLYGSVFRSRPCT
jgi:hypothetical protein